MCEALSSNPRTPIKKQKAKNQTNKNISKEDGYGLNMRCLPQRLIAEGLLSIWWHS
jgi:hypothetical protein